MTQYKRSFQQSQPRLADMKLACVTVSPDGEKRRIVGPPAIDASQLQRIAVVNILAARSLVDEAAARASWDLMPHATPERSPFDPISDRQALTALLGWDFDPAPYFSRPSPDQCDWYKIAGGVSSTAPGLFYLYRSASVLPAGFSWSPGQVSDVLQAVLHIKPVLRLHGLSRSPAAESALEHFQTFLALAHSNDGHILVSE